MTAADLPVGSAPDPVRFPHFPDRFHAFVWRNWTLAPVERMATATGAAEQKIVDAGRSMGLPGSPGIHERQWRRSYITIVRRNWHLLNYEQLLKLLDWTAEKLAFVLREDDFLFHKLGNLKPNCPPLIVTVSDETTRQRTEAIARVVNETFPGGFGVADDPLFGFIDTLSKPPVDKYGLSRPAAESLDAGSSSVPKYCASYFAVYGDTLLEDLDESYPDGYLQRLARTGVNGIWLQAVLYKLSPFPWSEDISVHYERRLSALAGLVERAKRFDIGVYLYLNEPRAMPLDFYEGYPELRGVEEEEYASLCTSVPEVRVFIGDAVRRICNAAPDLEALFTISASENLTNCWSHYHGDECPRCAGRSPSDVIGELHEVVHEGISEARANTRLIAWDWGWREEWIEEIVGSFPEDVAVQSVSEWSMPIVRGGVESEICEYAICEPGPGPRAKRTWRIAANRGLQTVAKVQANATWELASVPYIPALENVARHAEGVRDAKVDGLMLGWTLGGCPSPNLEVFDAMWRDGRPTVDKALTDVAIKRFGPDAAPHLVDAWKSFSDAFAEFPYHVRTVYFGPQQMGPANLLWEEETGYASTMVGFPYDDLDGWSAVYPASVYVDQFAKIADGVDEAILTLRNHIEPLSWPNEKPPDESSRYDDLFSEMGVMEACAVHFRSVANQGRFVLLRRELHSIIEKQDRKQVGEVSKQLRSVLESEIDLARRMYRLQTRDSRFGFEASNHYFYVPLDLAEKVLCCRDLIDRWLHENTE